MSKNARETALAVLEGCGKNRAFSDSLLAELLKKSGLEVRDRALASRLCYGVLQNSILLDYYIDWLSGGKKLEPKLRNILQLSIYQLLFMDRIPAHAAVSEGVELCKRNGLSRASGLANAILRRAAGGLGLPELPDTGDADCLSLKYSVPKDLVQLFIDEFGYEFAGEYLKASNEPPEISLMVNSLKVTDSELAGLLENEGISCKAHENLKSCLLCDGIGDISSLESFKKGLFYIQDPAAKMAVMASGADQGQTVLDACSAPGGKSFSAALQMNNRGKIISCDIHENKLSRVAKGAERLGIDIIETRVMDASAPFEEFINSFDIVIADLPCSGLGVLRKKPDIRFKDVGDLNGLPEVQLRILDGICGCVKDGGVLLYSTCTVLRRENEGLVSRFLEKHPEFSPEGFELPCVNGSAPGGSITLYPNVQGTDGFFICKLRKSHEN